MRRGTNLPAVGGYNQTVILDLIRRSGDGLSRVELAEQTGLSAQTVSNATRRLLDSAIVREAGKKIDGPGKPRTILQLAPEGRFAVGVHLDPAVITYVLLNLEGRIVAHSRTRMPSATPPLDIVERIAASVHALIGSAGVPVEHVLGVGIAAPGPIDRTSGTVLNPPLLDGWGKVPLREALLAATGLPVLLEKDVSAAAVAELWTRSPAARDNFVFFYYGTGFGMGLAVEHEVVRGASANAGDAGHLQTSSPRPCSCGRTGCVGEAIMPLHLVQDAIALGILAAPPAALDAAAALDAQTVDELFTRLTSLADAGDLGARRIVVEAAEYSAEALVAVVNLLDLDTVVFGGPFWSRVAPIFLAEVPHLIRQSGASVNVHPLTVTSSSIAEDVAAVGAACLVLDNTLSPRPTNLLISG